MHTDFRVCSSGGSDSYRNGKQALIKIAQVAELVDALDSKSSDLGRVGSIPTLSTVNPLKTMFLKGFFNFWVVKKVANSGSFLIHNFLSLWK